MSKVSVMGTLTSLEGKEAEMEEVLEAMVDAARREPGVEVYSYHRGPDSTYWFFALMSDEQAMRDHGSSDAMREAMAAFGSLAAGPPAMATTIPVAALGLDI